MSLSVSPTLSLTAIYCYLNSDVSHLTAADIQDSVPWDSEDTTVSVCSEQEIALLRQ